MASWTEYLLGPLIVVSTLAVATLSLLQHTVPLRADATLVLLVFDTRVLVTVAVGIFAASFLLYLHYLRGEDPSDLVDSGRTVEAIVPAFREAAVLDQSVEGLVAAAYEDLTITVVCEPEDTATIDRARQLSEAHDAVDYLCNTDRESSKAGALNAAIERSDADVVAIFDADQQPDPNLVPYAMAALDEYDAVRGRSLPRPDGGVLESLIYYEYLVLFFLPQKLARAAVGFNLAGTRSVFIEAAVFDEVGTFQEDSLTEDLEFSHRCHAAGVAIRELMHYPTTEEPAHNLRDWWGQRVRWMSGQVAVSRAQLADWRSLSGRRVAGSLVASLGTFVAGTLMAMTVPKLALGLLASPLVVGGGLAAVFALLLATRYVDTRVAGLEGFGLAWPLLPFAVTLYGLVVLQVVFESALGIENDWYSVEKLGG